MGCELVQGLQGYLGSGTDISIHSWPSTIAQARESYRYRNPFIVVDIVSFGKGRRSGGLRPGSAARTENAVVILIVDSLQHGSDLQSLSPCQVR